MEFWSTHPSLSSESQSAVTAMYLAMQLSYGTVAFIPSYRMKVIKKSLYHTLKSCKSTHIHESARPTLKIFNVHNWQKTIHKCTHELLFTVLPCIFPAIPTCCSHPTLRSLHPNKWSTHQWHSTTLHADHVDLCITVMDFTSINPIDMMFEWLELNSPDVCHQFDNCRWQWLQTTTVLVVENR